MSNEKNASIRVLEECRDATKIHLQTVRDVLETEVIVNLEDVAEGLAITLCKLQGQINILSEQ